MKTLFSDEHLLAVDKPPGRIVIPGRGTPEPTLREELQAIHGPLWVVHRLDRNTSGVLCFARSAAAHRGLNLAFDRHEIEKAYLALVRRSSAGEAVAPWEDRRVDLPLAPARRGRMRVAPPGDTRAKASATRLRAVETLGPFALVEATPETGRTHQIRVHLAAIGWPLALDPDYGEDVPVKDGAGRVLLSRTPLHATRLSFAHPITGGRVTVEAGMPEDMVATLEWIATYRGSAS